LLLLPARALAARVLVVGDTQYAMVAGVASDIQRSLMAQARAYSTSEVRGRLGPIVERENAQVVVALGAEAVGEALRLPPSVAVVFGLVVVPPPNGRANVTGVYMSPPVGEYLAVLQRHLPAINRVAVLGSPSLMKRLLGGGSAHVAAYPVGSSSELAVALDRISDARALLLLPDADLLIAPVLSKAFLFSFRRNIPLLGISEANVRQGALFALVFDPRAVSRQIAEKVDDILDGTNASELPVSPPARFDLFVNSGTATKMGIALPAEMLSRAKRVYP
jgi:ABC-type uncharacterized transport system substrate-binding protein